MILVIVLMQLASVAQSESLSSSGGCSASLRTKQIKIANYDTCTKLHSAIPNNMAIMWLCHRSTLMHGSSPKGGYIKPVT